jgi:hypothetical protein
MTRTAIATLGVVSALATGALAVGGASAAGAGAGAPPCLPKQTTIQKQTAYLECGPATVTLRTGGKTYAFRNGLCEQSKSAGTALQLTLGVVIEAAPKGNAGQPHFSMLVTKGGTLASIFSASFGGKHVLGDSLISVEGKLPAAGTFSGQDPIGNASFTGSWNCHGVVWATP